MGDTEDGLLKNEENVMKIAIDKKPIRLFGLGLAVMLTTFALWQFYKGRTTSSVVLLALGITSAASAIFFYPVIKPVYIMFMNAAHVLGWINTRIFLGLIFYGLITPMGLIMKVFGKDLLNERIEPDKVSYWIKREKLEFDKSKYEQQF